VTQEMLLPWTTGLVLSLSRSFVWRLRDQHEIPISPGEELGTRESDGNERNCLRSQNLRKAIVLKAEMRVPHLNYYQNETQHLPR
jgi:hypothetical protein